MVTFANLGSVRLPSFKFVTSWAFAFGRYGASSVLFIYNSFPVIRTTIEKNRHFTYPGLVLFALGTPLWQSRKKLHE